MENTKSMGRFRRMFDAYEAVCKPYCQEIGISVQAFEILLFIAKSEGTATAQDICKRQNIKPTLMSFHIEKLVQAGFIERQEIDGNRRSVRLVCTASAAPVVKRGAELYAKYTALIWDGVTEEEKTALFATLAKMDANAQKIIEGKF